MSKKPTPVSEEKFQRVMSTFTQHLLNAHADILTLVTALKEKEVISDADLARAVEKVTREGKRSLDDLANNRAKWMAMLRGKPTDVQ